MKDRQRTFLLGAGFSKAVADGPLMNEIWNYIEEAYKNEKNRKVSITGRNKRLEWFIRLDDFMKRLEGEAICYFNKKDFGEIQVGIRENIEYLFTLIDLHLFSSSPEIKFKKEGEDISPYPVIPFRFTDKFELEEIKSYLLTYLYIILVNLKGNDLVDEFSNIIENKDQIITFNYDLMLEKALWRKRIWSPLNGYVGVNRFRKENDGKRLEKAGRNSQIKIHKMHGSICWSTPQIPINDSIFIELDNKENWRFHFNGLSKLLGRSPIKPSSKIERNFSEGWGGKHNPAWILPSFIKPFEKKELCEIWKSALRVMSKTDELVVIGFSFRPEDSNSQLLIASLPDECNLIVVDKYPDNIRQRLKTKGLRIGETYTSLKEYLLENVKRNVGTGL
jgi:hypothetical protein